MKVPYLPCFLLCFLPVVETILFSGTNLNGIMWWMFDLFPRIFVWGSCSWLCTPVRVLRLLLLPPPPAPLTHHLPTHNLLTHHLPHTTYSHTTYSHTTYPPLSQRPSLSVAGVALTALGWLWWRASRLPTLSPRLFAWQAWQLVTSTFALHGRRGTWWHRPSLCVAGVALAALGWLWWRAWFPFAAVVAAALCVAGVALGDIDLRFAWQAWHLWWHRPSLCGAGVALTALGWLWWRASRLPTVSPRLFAWQAWQLVTSTFALHGRRGTWWHRPSLCVAGVALAALGWLWWRAWFPFAAVVAAALCVAGVALGDIDLRFAWQAWHLWWHRPSLCGAGVALTALGWLWWRAWFPFAAVVAAAVWVAGVALGDIDLRFAWQALVTSTVTLRGRRRTWGTGLALVARLVPVCRRRRRGSLRGRRGTWWHRPSLCMAGVELGDIDHHFAWQAWHLRHWAGSGDALGSRLPPLSPRLFAWQAWQLVTSTFALRGRRGTWWHRPSLCVAPVCRRCRRGSLRGRRGTWWHRPSLCVAGGTWWHRPSLCVAGVALAWQALDRYFAWPVCCRCRRGRLRGTWQHFVWQVWHLRHWAGSGDLLGSTLPPLSKHSMFTKCHFQHIQRFQSLVHQQKSSIRTIRTRSAFSCIICFLPLFSLDL